MALRNLKISTRLIAVMASLCALLIGIVLVALLQMQTMRGNTQEITEDWLPSVTLMGNLKATISNLRTLESQHVLNTDEGAMERLDKSMASEIAAIETLYQNYRKLISSP